MAISISSSTIRKDGNITKISIMVATSSIQRAEIVKPLIVVRTRTTMPRAHYLVGETRSRTKEDHRARMEPLKVELKPTQATSSNMSRNSKTSKPRR